MVAGNRDGSGISDELFIQNHRKERQRQKRNLKAAKESRRRKEENLMRLQSDAQAIEDRYSMLSVLVKSLKEELLDLRTQLLQHTSCQCILIHRYMEREARRYVEDQILRSIML
jgi:NTP pyrophosphatase (non-canonical NTP hydrolase)